MKSAWMAAAALLALVALSGCGGGEQSPAGDGNVAAPAEPAGPEAASPTEGTPEADADTELADVPEFELPEVDVDELSFTLRTKISAARTAVRRDPGNPQAVGQLGALYYVHGYPAAALQCFEHNLKLESGDMGWQYYVAVLHEKLGNTEAAIRGYRKALEEHTRLMQANPQRVAGMDIPIRLRLANLLVDGEPAEARQLFERALELQPERPAALIGLAELARAEGKTAEALARYRKAASMVPTHGPAHAALAELFRAEGNTARAEQHAAMAAELEPVDLLGDDGLLGVLRQRGLDPDVLLNLAGGLISDGNFEQAEQVIDQVLELDLKTAIAHNELGLVRAGQERLEDAISEFQTAIGIDPAFTRARSNLVLAYAEQERLDDARQVLEELFAQDPGSTVGLIQFARLQLEQEQPEPIAEKFEQVLGHHPHNPIEHYSVGVTMLGMGLTELAEQGVRKAVEIYPDLVQARFELGRLLHSQGKLDEALVQWQAATDVIPTHLPSRLAACETYYQDRQYGEAIACLKAGLETLPRSWQLANLLAWILATAPEAEYRDGEEAVKWAEMVNEQARYNEPTLLDTLACAHAEAGDFEEAVNIINRGLELVQGAQTQNQQQQQQKQALLNMLQERKELFTKQQPYRDMPQE